MNRSAVAAVVEDGLGALLADCRRFVEGAAIASLWQALGRFDGETFVRAGADTLGFRVDVGNRGRMLGVLTDLAAAAGWLRREGAEFVAMPLSPDRRPLPPALPGAGGEQRFFQTCLARAPAYLRGEVAGIDFDAPAEDLWDAFLACPLHEFGRRWVLTRTDMPDAPGRACLDVAYGTGRSTAALCRRYPRAEKVAVDQRGRYQTAAARRCAEVLERGGAGATPVTWSPPCSWKGGFDVALPFPDGSFDLVFFSCGAPYLGPERMAGFYADLHRVLRPGGRLALLAWVYPTNELPVHRSTRLRTLIHDFCESVCVGWQGFPSATELEGCLQAVGFEPVPALQGSFFGLDGAAVIAARREAS